jgi:outer membrane lipoprotein-sorting protein
MRKFILFITILSIPLGSYAQTQVNARKLAEDMLAKMAMIKTLKYRMYKKERLNGKYRESELDAKYHKSPFKIYMYMYSPDPGVEVLYVDGANDGKAFVNPNKKILSFLDLDFDPLGKTLRKDEHHTIFESGFEYMRGILKSVMKVAEEEGKFDEYCNVQGEVNFNGRPCHKVLLQYPKFQWIDYKVKSGEDVIKIARAKSLSEFMIMEKNKLSNYTSVKAGQTIKIPNIYAKKVILYIDKLYLLPVFQEVHDDIGMFEEYHYKNLIVNPAIPETEFSRDFKDYKF